VTDRGTSHQIVLVRELAAPAYAVYAAWTDLAEMKRWMGSEVEADLRVGGAYRIAIDAGGARFIHEGRHLVVEPGRRIVRTFRAGPEGSAPPEPGPYRDEFTEIRLVPLAAGRTGMTFVNGWDGAPMGEDERKATTAAWSAWLDGLTALFADPAGPA